MTKYKEIDLDQISDYDLVDLVVERLPDMVDDDLLYIWNHLIEKIQRRYKEE